VTQKPTILVVDDEDLIRWSLSERLRSEGCTVLEAEDGRRALDHAGEHVDLAVLDYRLPDTDGLTLLRRLKAQHPQLMALMLTAYDTPETATEAVEAGAFNLARKPFDLDDIVVMVRDALEAPSGPRPEKASGPRWCSG
jgi:two-component system, NtrC family, response regulator AtoC